MGIGVFIFSVLLIILLMSYYLVKSYSKLKILSKIKNKILRVIISIVPFVILILLLGFINTIVIVFHLFVFTILFNILFLIINKKKYNNDLVVLIGLIITCIYLGIGVYLNYHVFETNYVIETDKNIGTDKFRIIQISDAHIGTSFDGKGFGKQIDKLSKIESDLFVITGDFIDDNTTYEDMKLTCEALSKLKPKYGIYYVNGNHDKGYGSRKYKYADYITELEKSNVKILVDDVVDINEYIYLIGREDKQVEGRKSIFDLTKDLDKSKYIIDLNHQPNDYKNESESDVDLVLSGHTHGGQLFPLNYVGVMIGANDASYGLEKRNNTNFIITSGISGWELIFKTGTFSEYVIIDIVNRRGEL